MQESVKERVAKLREEITRIRAANEAYLRGARRNAAEEPDHERRKQRLKEIMHELSSLTNWKKT